MINLMWAAVIVSMSVLSGCITDKPSSTTYNIYVSIVSGAVEEKPPEKAQQSFSKRGGDPLSDDPNGPSQPVEAASTQEGSGNSSSIIISAPTWGKSSTSLPVSLPLGLGQ